MRNLGGGGAEPRVCRLVSLSDGGWRHGAGVGQGLVAARQWWRQGERLVKDATRIGHDPVGSAGVDEIAPFCPFCVMELLVIHHLAKQLLPQERARDRHIHGRHDHIVDLSIRDPLASFAVVDLPRIRGVMLTEFLVPPIKAAQDLAHGDVLTIDHQNVLAMPEHLLHSPVDSRDVFVAQKFTHLLTCLTFG